MLWRGRRQSDNVEDARGQGGGGMPGGFGRNSGPIRIPIGGRAGGGGITGIIILVILFFVLRACGIDPMQILDGGDQSVAPGGGGTVSETNPPASDEMKQFVATVLAETEDTWNGIFQSQGLKYEEPTLKLFSGSIASACGNASSASGPFYCPERPQGLSRHRLLRPAGQPVRRFRRFRRGLRDRARGRPPRPEPHRDPAQVQPDAAADERGRGQPDVDPRRAAGRLLRRRSGRISPTRRAFWNRAISRRRSTPRSRSATTRCRRGCRAMSFPKASTTARRSSA